MLKKAPGPLPRSGNHAFRELRIVVPGPDLANLGTVGDLMKIIPTDLAKDVENPAPPELNRDWSLFGLFDKTEE